MGKFRNRISGEVDVPVTTSEEPVIIALSPQAKANLEKLQLRSLDKRGRQPAPSQVIEGLINAAAVREPDAPYPG